MQIRSSRLICAGIMVLFLVTMAEIGSADEVNVELVSHLGGVVQSVAVEGNYAYIGQGQDLVVLDITEISSPSEMGRVITPYVVNGITVSGNYVYLAGRNGLVVIDIADPSSPTIASISEIGYVADIAVSENYAYLAAIDLGLVIVDISDPYSPTLKGSYNIAGFAENVVVSGNYAYLAATDPSLVIIDVSDPYSPTLKGSYDTAGFAEDVVISSNYAYITNSISYGGEEVHDLEIVDITDPSSPTLAGSYDYPNIALCAAVSGNYAYIVDWDKGLLIVDITDPSSPILTGNYYVDNSPTFVAVSDNYAYLVDATNDIVILDISDPYSPTLAGNYDTPGSAVSVAVSGNYAYMTDGWVSFFVVHITDSYSPIIVSTHEASGDFIAVSGNYAYLAGDNGLEIIDISNLYSPTLVGSYERYNTEGDAEDVTVVGNYAYVAFSEDGLLILDISDPYSPTLVSSYDTDDYATGVAISGNYAYVTNFNTGLVILDISNPSSPILIGSYDIDDYGNTYGVAVSGNYAYIANGWSWDGFVILDISNPDSPTLVGSCYTGGGVEDIVVSGNHAFVTDDNGLEIIDITDPYSPILSGTYYSAGSTLGHAVSGNYVYVAENDNGLVILRVSPAPDTIPPASVTNLKETGIGSSWINWTWTNPTNPDFSHVMVYINGAFLTNTSGNFTNYYNATGLAEGITYTIGLQTGDIFGNINSTWMNDSATTLKLPKVSNVSGTNITTSSITLVWEASNDTSKVEIHRNDLVLANVSGSTTYVDTNLSSGTTYTYALIPYNISGLQGKAVSVSLRTTSSSSGGGGGGGSSTSKSSSGGGGGGGAGSAEDFANVALKDVDREYLRMNTDVTYEFRREGNPIQSVSFYSLKNSGEITSSIEVLNNSSKLVNSTPEGILYKYVNIWVGKSGFATAANIKDANVRFKVQSSWINEMGLSPADVKLQRYNGAAWEVLPTNVESNATDYVVFESQTSGFSPFAITAERQVVASAPAEAATTPIQKEDAVVEATQPEKTPGFGFSMAILMMGILAAGYAYLKKKQN